MLSRPTFHFFPTPLQRPERSVVTFGLKVHKCQCQYEIYSAPITKRTWVHYIVTELVNSCDIVLKAKLKQNKEQTSKTQFFVRK